MEACGIIGASKKGLMPHKRWTVGRLDITGNRDLQLHRKATQEAQKDQEASGTQKYHALPKATLL